MFYRSGWLRCVGLKCMRIGLSFWKIIDVRAGLTYGVRLFLLLLLHYYIIYYILLLYLILSSSSSISLPSFLYSPPLPFSSHPSSPPIFLSFIPSPIYLFFQSSSSSSSPNHPHSKYTCRYLHLLIYILPASQTTI